jgi:hypothetical protein
LLPKQPIVLSKNGFLCIFETYKVASPLGEPVSTALAVEHLVIQTAKAV